MDDLEITPSTTVDELLKSYPDLEERLVGIAPPFKKLQNPLLRRSIAKVATIKNIASVGNIPLDELVNRLREEVGHPKSNVSYVDDEYFTAMPEWYSSDKVAVSIIEADVEDQDKMTVVTVLREAKKLKKGEIIELITTFLPAPGIDSMRAKGFSVWTTRSDESTIRTYFLKHQD